MKALVTGGSGFIGSNVVRKLLTEEYDVRVFDNLSTGYAENLKDFDVEKVKGDVRDQEAVEKACEGIDVVFHLAASVGRQRSIDYPVLDSTTNLIGTVNVLEGMRKNNVSRIVYSSSAAMFGELLTPTIDESHPQNADSPYGVSKLAAEKMILAYAGIYTNIVPTCLRYFNIYGVNQRYDAYGNVIPIFAQRIYTGRPITIFGDGEQTRDFVNVEDVARANWLGSQVSETTVCNLGSGSSVTINYLANKMQEIAGINVGIEYAPKRPADVLHCKANAEKAQKTIGFKVEVSLEEGLSAYMNWFKSNCI